MSKNLKTLLTIAAENRVVGISWESIARKVHRKKKPARAGLRGIALFGTTSIAKRNPSDSRRLATNVICIFESGP
jgi:hypothetical protein